MNGARTPNAITAKCPNRQGSAVMLKGLVSYQGTQRQLRELLRQLNAGIEKASKVYGKGSTVVQDMDVLHKEFKGSIPELRTYWAR